MLHDGSDVDSHLQDGFHELHNEPSPVKEKFIDECISWVEARVRTEPTSTETTEPAIVAVAASAAAAAPVSPSSKL